MLFPYLAMVHSCVPSELVNDTYLRALEHKFSKTFPITVAGSSPPLLTQQRTQCFEEQTVTSLDHLFP